VPNNDAVVVLGGSGFVGSRLRQLWPGTGAIEAPSHARLDVLDPVALADFLRQSRASAVVNVAAWADVDGGEAQRGDTGGTVFRLNAELPGRLAEVCGEQGKYLLHVSTDYVFDGARTERPYREDDPTGPWCWYAQTKREGEQRALASGASVCVARIEMPFSAHDFPRKDVARTFRARLEAGQPIQGVVDQRITPVFLDDAVEAMSRLTRSRYTGVIHVAATTSTTPYEYARTIARRLALDPQVIQPTTFADFVAMRPARRPQHSWLDVTQFESAFGPDILHTVDEQLERWAAQVHAAGRS
jgi:dTDP-4-dehydrorhamnose reductase